MPTSLLRSTMIALLGLLLGGLPGLTAASSAPPGHALPFYGTATILEGPQTDGERRRDAESIIFALPVGSQVRASQEGEVVFSGWQGPATGYLESALGVVVHLRHDDGTVSEYGHLNDVDVPIGARVQRGQFIAHSGMTGETQQPALAFAILIGTSGTGFDGWSISIRELPGLDWEQRQAVGSGVVLPIRNLALGAVVWSTSTESDAHRPELAIDGNSKTRFASGHRSQPETISVLLPGRRIVSRVAVQWEQARPLTWSVWITAPGEDGLLRSSQVWRTTEGLDEARFDAVEAVAVMVRSEDHWQRGWANVSLFEIEIEGFG